MSLTDPQLDTLKAWLDANAAGLQDEQAAALLNATAAPDYYRWKSNASRQALDALIDKAAFTPADSAPAATGNAQGTNDALLYQNRCLVAQLKQMNANWLTAGVGTVDARLSSVRKNFQDCLRQLPTGAAGANQDAGWGAPAAPGAVRLEMMTKVTVGEKLFTVVVTGPGNDGGTRGTKTNPDQCGTGKNGALLEGQITVADVSAGRNRP